MSKEMSFEELLEAIFRCGVARNYTQKEYYIKELLTRLPDIKTKKSEERTVDEINETQHDKITW